MLDVAGRQTPRVRPRYGRMSAAGSALVVTLVTLLGGMGVLPTDAPAAEASGARSGAQSGAQSGPQARLATLTFPDRTHSSHPGSGPDSAPDSDSGSLDAQDASSTALPADSGTGKRVVFDISDQRVWLVQQGDDVVRTYLVSGSLTDNLGPGTYDVYSRSRWASGIADSGVMEYFVRFTRGANAAIGFHSIPTKDGRPLQTRAQLGTPQSHGCIRQAMPDARRLWAFAPVGTKVVVTD